MALALIPVSVIAVMFLALIVPITQVSGVGSNFGFLWSVVWDGSLASGWRIAMASVTLTLLGGLIWLLFWLTPKFAVWFDDRVRRWGQ